MRNCNVTTSKLIASDKHIILRWYTLVRGLTKLNFYRNKITLNTYEGVTVRIHLFPKTHFWENGKNLLRMINPSVVFIKHNYISYCTMGP